MKSIKEKAKKTYPTLEGDLLGTNESLRRREGFEASANYALDAIEEFMTNLYFGSNDAEMFYKDLKANIHKFIEQLKGNQ